MPSLALNLKGHHEAMVSEFASLAESLKGEEITPEGFAAFLEAMAPVIDFVMRGGQRWKDPRKLTTNTQPTITQRLYVLTHIIAPHVHGFETMTEIGAELGVCKSMVMRHMKDFNVAFGVFAPNQKRVSAHAPSLGEDGIYVRAAKRGHQTRRERLKQQSPNNKSDV